jgi:Glycosyl transferase family 2
VSPAAHGKPRIFGVLMTRNEVDLLRINIVHHLQTSCERILVVDNGSTDASRTVLKRLAAKLPVDWTVDRGTLQQGEVVTGLAHEAVAKGAEWVIPLDTDEFWHASRQLRDVVAEVGDAGGIEVPRIEFVQARDQKRSNARGLLRMDRRVEHPLLGNEPVREFSAGRRSMFETAPQPKLLMRATPELAVNLGGHTAEGLAGEVKVADEIVIFHAPIRSHAALDGRAEQGRRVAQLSDDDDVGVQARFWERMRAEGRLQEAWRAHSYEDGAVLVGERRVELIEDDRLNELLAPWVRTAGSELVARLTGRSW